MVHHKTFGWTSFRYKEVDMKLHSDNAAPASQPRSDRQTHRLVPTDKLKDMHAARQPITGTDALTQRAESGTDKKIDMQANQQNNRKKLTNKGKQRKTKEKQKQTGTD